MQTLTIKLTAPLQSYGNPASFLRRTTGDYPSKSAIVGLLAAALGYRRKDQRTVRLNDLDFAVRIDQVGVALMDYQTVEWKPNTRKITYRDYLQDALFVVALGSNDDALIEQLVEALRHPKFQPFLGRRANVPAGPLQVQTFADASPITVLSEILPWQAAAWYQRQIWYRKQTAQVAVDLVADAALLPDQTRVMVKDRMVSFDQRHRQHGFRAVAAKQLHFDNPYQQRMSGETQQNPLAYL
ncbi:type I-E CRISPR-associated protein Cas5/CasD [Levilactobacillus suantsaii]|uniref:Type I-E CRISPR-associated protein Cas5/CasD n=1 Tax=Levilactobacillus suantsaii TaxID=2292255 RepID=A0A4Q0VHY6_9LACO|nr:type I-E CRISPR-associated protein Cas5/CasD [Levilactobacillus suantsaii]QMU08782.1 type I-E CRISPR-associated protein Cas5/CasD [Levilactobacillus suantsaii]RXI78952.1 type I-E CRISPR-associated protein Cas5/CasD [Levilactobacillus suantsaii]